ncbi:MAG TPA: outer membrane lipoprotein chaperone LolA [Pseudomonadales bacterium]
MSMIKRFFLKTVIMVWALLATSAVAANAGLQQKLSSFDAYQATFIQQTFDSQGQSVQSISGHITLQKPDRFFWQSDEPYAQQLVSNGQLIWHYDADLEQVVVQEYAEQLDKAPMLLVLRDASRLADSYRVTQQEAAQGRVRFVLQAIDSQSPLSRVELVFAGEQLVELLFVDQLQQKTLVQFANIVMNPVIDAALFDFQLPDGADVLYE